MDSGPDSDAVKGQTEFGVAADRVKRTYPQFFIAAVWSGFQSEQNVIYVTQDGLNDARNMVAGQYAVKSLDALIFEQREALEYALMTKLDQAGLAESGIVSVHPITSEITVEFKARSDVKGDPKPQAESLLKSELSRFLSTAGVSASTRQKQESRAGGMTIDIGEEFGATPTAYGGPGFFRDPHGKPVCTGAYTIRQGNRYGVATAAHCAKPMPLYDSMYGRVKTTRWNDKLGGHRGDVAAMWVLPGGGTAYPRHASGHSTYRTTRLVFDNTLDQIACGYGFESGAPQTTVHMFGI